MLCAFFEQWCQQPHNYWSSFIHDEFQKRRCFLMGLDLANYILITSCLKTSTSEGKAKIQTLHSDMEIFLLGYH